MSMFSAKGNQRPVVEQKLQRAHTTTFSTTSKGFSMATCNYSAVVTDDYTHGYTVGNLNNGGVSAPDGDDSYLNRLEHVRNQLRDCRATSAAIASTSNRRY